MGRFVFFVLMFLVLSACDADSEREPALWLDRNAMETHLYYETFDYSQVKLTYMDDRGEMYTFPLEEDMIVNAPELRFGPINFHVQYRNAEAFFEIHLGNEPTRTFSFSFEGIDTVRGHMFFSHHDSVQVPLSQSTCTLPDYDPPELEGYLFSHFDPPLDEVILCEEHRSITLHYEPEVYEINFFDHEGELIETVEVLYNDSIDDYRHAFPHYIHFNSWNKDLRYIRGSKDVHPNIVWTTYAVWFYDHEGEFHAIQHVKHGQAATFPEPPERAGHEFIAWDQSLDSVTETLYVHPVYEPTLNVSDPLDDANALNNYTIAIEWENIPYGEGHVTHRFKVDGDKVHADYFGEFYLVKEAGETFIIATYDFDDHEHWYKWEYTGDDVVTMVAVDVLSIEASMLNYAVTHYTLDSAYYEAIFGSDHDAVVSVEITYSEGILYIDVEWTNDVRSLISLYDIGSTEFELPEYIDET